MLSLDTALHSASHLLNVRSHLAGIMPIMTYGGFKRMTGFCKTKVPKDILSTLESIKDNDEAVKQFGIDLGTQMCRRILDSGVPGLHMYTLNTEVSSVSILENLGLINKAQVCTTQLLLVTIDIEPVSTICPRAWAAVLACASSCVTPSMTLAKWSSQEKACFVGGKVPAPVPPWPFRVETTSL